MSERVWVQRVRGHAIEWLGDDRGWRYAESCEPYDPTRPETDRLCIKCGKKPTPEGHDGCLGTLPGVKFACCGHGFLEDTYVAFEDERLTLYGEPAADYFDGERA